MAPRFHIPVLLSPSHAGSTIALPTEVAHHLVRVLRLQRGDPITLFDGGGGEYAAVLEQTGRSAATARIVRFDAIARESPLAITLAQAVLATDAMDYAIRKAVELGAGRIAPVAAARSQALRGDRGGRRLAHWRAIAIAACEQCGRNRIPAIDDVQPLDEWLRASADGERTAMMVPAAELSLAALAARTPPDAILVGPEGGFTDAERSLAIDTGVVAVHLGPRVLRAETAGPAALAVLNAVAGDAR